MNTISATNSLTAESRPPVLVRKVGDKTFEVFVHFSKTSTETLTDKIMRLVQNNIQSADLSQ